MVANTYVPNSLFVIRHRLGKELTYWSVTQPGWTDEPGLAHQFTSQQAAMDYYVALDEAQPGCVDFPSTGDVIAAYHNQSTD